MGVGHGTPDLGHGGHGTLALGHGGRRILSPRLACATFIETPLKNKQAYKANALCSLAWEVRLVLGLSFHGFGLCGLYYHHMKWLDTSVSKGKPKFQN